MKLSAVMALYNTPYEYLQKTIESILNQSFQDFELLIIDDCSTIEYEKFLSQFNDSRIKYYKLEKNSGPSNARNYGIKIASGEYIAICDSDDVYEKDRFKLQVEYLNSHPNISVLGGAYKFSNKLNKVIKPKTNVEDLKIELLFNSPFANPIIMLRKNSLIDNNFYFPENLKFAEDYYLWIKLLFAKYEMTNLDEVLMIYTRRSGQLSKQNTEKQKHSLEFVFKTIFENLQIDYTADDIESYYKIAINDFKNIKQTDIEQLFNKIIEANDIKNIFDNQKLKEKFNYILIQYNKINSRIFKLKIGSKNFCIYKPFKVLLENRD